MSLNGELFDDDTHAAHELLLPGAVLLRRFALAEQDSLISAVSQVLALAPLRQMITPGGFRMSVATTSCGQLGWISDRRGYRYSSVDPLTDQPWPVLPHSFFTLAQSAAMHAGYTDFVPDACLINRYGVGNRMSLHQDRNEKDFSQPIVSVSLGLPVTFQLGGLERSDKALKVRLEHGDVLVWGGPSRLRFHGVLPLKAGAHTSLGEQRINLTFRRAGGTA